MRIPLVAVDLETTGLDNRTDKIIEIGAVRVEPDGTEREFQSFVHLQGPIPAATKLLTGISDEDVAAAPPLEALKPQLIDLFEGAYILGHNVAFDLGFLRAAGLQITASIDTYALASVLLPNSPRYSLAALAEQLGVPLTQAHRALHDARASYEVFVKLAESAAQLPDALLAEIASLGAGFDWGAGLVFDEIARDRNVLDAAADRAVSVAIPPLAAERLPRGADPVSLPEAVQVQFDEAVKAVASTLMQREHLMLEMPAGVDRFAAYGAVQNRLTASNNPNLMLAVSSLERLDSERQQVPFPAALMFSRGHYLCPLRLAAMRRRGPSNPDEMHILAKTLIWLHASQAAYQGIRPALRRSVEHTIWGRLSAAYEACTVTRCDDEAGGQCHYAQSLRSAQAASTVLVDHSLLAAPDEIAQVLLNRALLIDEAQRLEANLSDRLGYHADGPGILAQLNELGTQQGKLLHAVLKNCAAAELSQKHYAAISAYVDTIAEASSALRQHIERYLAAVSTALRAQTPDNRGEYIQQIVISGAVRQALPWSQVQQAWDSLEQFLSVIAASLVSLADGLEHLRARHNIPYAPSLERETRAAAEQLRGLQARLDQITSKPQPNWVYWGELRPDGSQTTLHAAPFDISRYVDRLLINQKNGLVLSGSVLRADASFNLIRSRLGLGSVPGLALPSALDNIDHLIIYQVENVPDAAQGAQLEQALVAFLAGLHASSEPVRVLSVYTSYALLKRVQVGVTERLTGRGILCAEVGDPLSTQPALAEAAFEAFGARAYWEGSAPSIDVDVQVLTQLPFEPPGEPLTAARGATYSKAFAEFTLPSAVLRFRQAADYLLRSSATSTGRRAFVIFDSRMTTKGYGGQFLRALPRVQVVRIKLEEAAPTTISRWLAAGIKR